MYAVIKTGGKQYKVSVERSLKVRLAARLLSMKYLQYLMTRVS